MGCLAITAAQKTPIKHQREKCVVVSLWVLAIMHSFSPDIASKVGVNAAVIYQNISWWCEKNAANGKNFKDGRHWTYNSVEAWAKLFPYFTGSQIRTALEKLEAAGLIISANHNDNTYDRTKWYADGLASPICEKSQMDMPIISNGYEKNRNSYKDTVSKPDGNTDVLNKTDYESEFDELWEHYPKKVARKTALSAYRKARRTHSQQTICEGLNAFIQSKRNTSTQYLPNLASWLNAERWNDEPTHDEHQSSDPTLRLIAQAARMR